jgi:DNA-binding ferritin-like protein
MFNTEFEKQYKEATKQFEELAERVKEVNEFWFNAVISSTKDLFKQVKSK